MKMSKVKNFVFVLKYPRVVQARSLKQAKELLDEEYLVSDFGLNRLELRDMKLSKITRASKKDIKNFIENFEEYDEGVVEEDWKNIISHLA